METTDLADELVECVTRIRRVLDSRLQVHGVSVARTRVLGALVDGPARQAGPDCTNGEMAQERVG